MNLFVKIVVVMALLAVAAVGLAMSLCGGVFTFGGLFANDSWGVLAISVPSLLAGLGMTWFASKKLLGQLGEPPER